MNRRKRLLIMFGIAAALVIVGALLIPVTSAPGAAGTPPNLFVLMAPFILIFVGVIIGFIGFIIWLATTFNDRISDRPYRIVERLLIAGIILGVIGMIQPWVLDLFKWGFLLLLFSTLVYIVWSHIVPRGATESQTTGPVSINEMEQPQVAK